MRARKPLRRDFIREFWRGLLVRWPIVSVLLLFMALLGMAVGELEGWPEGIH